MKKPLIILPFISLLFFMVVSFGFSSPVRKNMNNTVAKKGFAVVELFTSEGCSSCPPADEAVAALVKDYPSNVFLLCFHVDYWNYLGWKDEFSSAENTNRQQAYAAAFNLTSIYTPEAVINGKTEFTGSDKRKLYASVEEELNNDNHAVIELSAKTNGLKTIVVSYKTNMDNKSILQIALVQLQAVSAVKRGENKGKELHHVNVVRYFKTADAAEGSVNISIPEGLSAAACKIIAFMQNRSDMHISAASECMIGH